MALKCPTLCVIILLVWLADLSLSSTESDDNDQSLIVETTKAKIRGKRIDLQPHQLSAEHGRSVVAFTRIPYAEPPVGELRFARPVGKVVEGDFDATEPSIACMQATSPLWDIKMERSEDCLTVDVFVPSPKPKSAAVLLWIHGGGYHMGAGSIPLSTPVPLAAYGDVIVVTCNYRLGALGFLATGDDVIPANIGLLDQREAMQWVQDNIAAFGGDPARVTIFGESAGSSSVNLHLLSPMSAGLFSGAILQSGALTFWTHHPNMEEAAAMTFELGEAVGCDITSSRELLNCLRHKPVENIMALFENEANVTGKFFVRPVADGAFLPEDPMKMAADGAFNRANVMIGCLKDEGTLFIGRTIPGYEGIGTPVVDDSNYRQVVGLNLNTQDDLTMDVTAFVYTTDDQISSPDPDYLYSATNLVGHNMFLCPTFETAGQLARAGHNVYTYLMTHEPTHSIWGSNATWFRATHAEEIPYVFGTPFMFGHEAEDTVMSGRFGSEDEVEMSLQMIAYWANFAKTGNPDSSMKEGASTDSRYPAWPASTPLEPAYKELSPTFETRSGYPNAKECYFLKELLPKLTDNAAERSRLKELEEKEQAVHMDP